MGTKLVQHTPVAHNTYRTHVKLTAHPVNTAAIAGGADKGFGVKVFGFDDDLAFVANCNKVIVTGAGIDLSLSESDGNITADTPDLGLGTVVASGTVAVLSGTATFENILTGQTMNDCNDTREVNYVDLAQGLTLAVTSDCYLNLADGWAASGESAGTLVATGDIVVDWFVFGDF